MNQASVYIFYVSIILNGVFLMMLFGIVPFFLYLSIIFNLCLLWYIKKSLSSNKDFEEDVTEMMKQIDSFTDHIEGVYELEMFYGDENLEKLLIHSRELVNSFIDFQGMYSDVEIEEEFEEEETREEI